jgi:hypothetical protein
VSTVNINISEACSRECHAAQCRLPWNGRWPFRTYIVTTMRMLWSFDSLSHKTLICILKTGHKLCNIFDLHLTSNQIMETLCANFVPLCVPSQCIKLMSLVRSRTFFFSSIDVYTPFYFILLRLKTSFVWDPVMSTDTTKIKCIKAEVCSRPMP